METLRSNGWCIAVWIVNAVVLQWKALGIIPVSISDLAGMAPAIVTIIALVLLARRVNAPAALTKPFVRS